MTTQLLAKIAIPFHWAMTLSDKNATAAEQNLRVEQTASLCGDAGVVALWMLQGYYDPEEPLPNGLTPATRWWLEAHNPWSALVRDMLTILPDAENAAKLLCMATCVPDVGFDVSRRLNGREYEQFTPGAVTVPSNLHAASLRQLAQTFFPQFPELAQPTCPLYRESVPPKSIMVMDDDRASGLCYDKPFEAFAGEEKALEYLAIALPGNCVGQMPTHLFEFRLNKNDAWRMYEQLGLSLEEGYALAIQEKQDLVMELPTELGDTPSTQ